jgi:hypothetical protein
LAISTSGSARDGFGQLTLLVRKLLVHSRFEKGRTESDRQVPAYQARDAVLRRRIPCQRAQGRSERPAGRGLGRTTHCQETKAQWLSSGERFVKLLRVNPRDRV